MVTEVVVDDSVSSQNSELCQVHNEYGRYGRYNVADWSEHVEILSVPLPLSFDVRSKAAEKSIEMMRLLISIFNYWFLSANQFLQTYELAHTTYIWGLKNLIKLWTYFPVLMRDSSRWWCLLLCTWSMVLARLCRLYVCIRGDWKINNWIGIMLIKS